MADRVYVNPVDRVIGWFSPRRELARFYDRQSLKRAYEAASPRDPWKPRRAGASANADHIADASTMRSKARSLVQNVPYMRAGIDALVANVVGTGIMPRATGQQADVLNTLFKQWCKVADADGRLDYYGLQAAAYHAMEQDGEVLIRLRARRPTDGLPVPLQLQLLEIDWLDSTRTGIVSGNTVVNGIEYDVLGRVIAYWLWDQHPGDVTITRGSRTQSTRVDAANIIHLFSPERPGQGRGFTRLAPVINTARDLQLLMDAELARKNLESRMSVLASGDVASLANPATPSAIADPDAARRNGDLGQLGSGNIIQLPAGMNVTHVKPEALPGYVETVKLYLHLVAVGMGVTYEMLTGDVSETNFSSARVNVSNFRRGAERTQWLTLVPQMCDRIWRAFVDAAELAGKIRRADYTAEHSTPRWDYVNPEQDVKSDLALISGGLLTPSEALRRRGYNPDDVTAELHADMERWNALKVGEVSLLDILLLLQKAQTAAALSAPAPTPAPAAK